MKNEEVKGDEFKVWATIHLPDFQAVKYAWAEIGGSFGVGSTEGLDRDEIRKEKRQMVKDVLDDIAVQLDEGSKKIIDDKVEVVVKEYEKEVNKKLQLARQTVLDLKKKNKELEKLLKDNKIKL